MSEQKIEDSNSNKICWVFIGTTGAGKSSCISTMTNSKVETSDKAESCTKDIGIFECKPEYKDNGKDIILFDTRGCQDTDTRISDKQVLDDITNRIASVGCPNMKIIWCVKPQDREVPELQKQARFIQSLSVNAWKSTIIVCKEGNTASHVQGAKSAAKRVQKMCGISPIIDVPSINAHLMDLIKDYKTESPYDFIYDRPILQRVKKGYLYSNEFGNYLTNNVSKFELQNSKAKLKLENRHSKEHKIITQPKHKGSLIIKFEHKGTILKTFKHEEQLTITESHLSNCKNIPIRKHKGSIKEVFYHNESTTKKHDGYFISRTKRHSSTTNRCIYCNSSNITWCKYYDESWVSTWRCYHCNVRLYEGDNFWHCNNCCDKGGSDHLPAVKRCNGMYCASHYKKSCDSCGNSVSSQGCIDESEWSCCSNGDRYSQGCKTVKKNFQISINLCTSKEFRIT